MPLTHGFGNQEPQSSKALPSFGGFRARLGSSETLQVLETGSGKTPGINTPCAAPQARRPLRPSGIEGRGGARGDSWRSADLGFPGRKIKAYVCRTCIRSQLADLWKRFGAFEELRERRALGDRHLNVRETEEMRY